MPRPSTAQGTYALLAELPLEIETYWLEPLSAQCSTDRVRRSTVIHRSGRGEEGAGEDATPIEAEQLAAQEARPTLDLVGEWTIDSFSSHVATLEFVPESTP